MQRMEEEQAQEIRDIEEALRLKEEQEAERARRDEEAREQAPWQDEAWEGEDGEERDVLDVEWSDGEE